LGALATHDVGCLIGSQTNVIRILHVDDDSALLEVSRLVLGLEGDLEVDQATSADEALQKIANGNYDIVISDYEMPQKDGLELLKALRDQNNSIPFILFTGKGREDVAIKALNLGADGYHNKQGSTETVYGELVHSIRVLVERSKTRKALVEKEETFSKLASQSPGMLYQFVRKPDGSYCVPYTSKQINEIFGCTPEAVRDDFSPIAKAILPEDLEKVIKSIEDSAQHLTPWQCEYRVRLPDGIHWMWGQSTPEKLADGRIVWSGFNTDITERKKAEEALAQSEARYRSLYENSFDGIMLSKPDGTILAANPQACRMLGMTEEEIKKAGRDGIVVQNGNQALALLESDRTGRVRAELTFKRKDGTTFIGEVSSNAFTDINGEKVKSVLIRDITESKNAEDRLRGTFEILEKVSEGIDAGLAVIDKEYNVIWANKRLTDMGVLKNKKCFSAFNKSEVCPDCGVKKVFEQNIPLSVHEYESVDDSGQTIWTELRVTPLRDQEGQTIAAIELAIPITERKKIEKLLQDNQERLQAANDELMNSKERYRSLFEQAPIPVAITTLDGKVIDANQAMQKLMGLSLEGLNNVSVETFYEDPQEREKLIKIIKEQGSAVDFYTQLKTATGEIIDAVLNVSKFQSGQKTLLRTTIQNVTERKKAEDTLNEIFEKLVLVNEKLNVVGRITRHDVRNKLSAINGYAYLLKKKHSDKPDIVEALSKMEQAVKESTKVFDFARMYEQLGAEDLTYIDLGQAVTKAVTLLSGFNLKLVNVCTGLEVLADSLLVQLLYNLIDNTMKYGQKSTTIKLYWRQTADKGVQLIYEDDGVGVPLENKSRIFDEGFSTGGSSGYGLYLVKRMMEIYGWNIEENGEPGQGAKFTITIPYLNRRNQKTYRNQTNQTTD